MNITKSATLFALIGITVCFTACNDRKEVEALKTETMRIHDEAMKDMGPMNAISRSIKNEMETLDSLSPRRDSLRNAVSNLERAEEEMMNWMKNYKDPGENMPKEEAVKYLQEQKTAIEKNLNSIRTATKEAMRYE